MPIRLGRGFLDSLVLSLAEWLPDGRSSTGSGPTEFSRYETLSPIAAHIPPSPWMIVSRRPHCRDAHR